MAGAAWPLSSAADLLPASLSLTLLLASLVAVLVLGFAAVFFEHIRKIGCMHSLERTAVSDAFFEDPSSLNKVPCPSIFDPAEKYISLIVPAYNEEHRLPEALTETLNYLKQRSAAEKSFTYEVLIVDDGSTDHTSKVAFEYVKRHKIDNVRVLLLGRSHGKGEAVRKMLMGQSRSLIWKSLKLRSVRWLKKLSPVYHPLLVHLRDYLMLKLLFSVPVLIWRSKLLPQGNGTGTFL